LCGKETKHTAPVLVANEKTGEEKKPDLCSACEERVMAYHRNEIDKTELDTGN